MGGVQAKPAQPQRLGKMVRCGGVLAEISLIGIPMDPFFASGLGEAQGGMPPTVDRMLWLPGFSNQLEVLMGEGACIRARPGRAGEAADHILQD